MARKKRGEFRPTAGTLGVAARQRAANFRNQTSRSDSSVWLIGIALAVLTFAAFWSVRDCGFVNLDDDAYVQFAPMVTHGIRGAAVVWAFTATHGNNWHPLTSLSHMLDCDLFGVRPGPMHMENVCWHTMNIILIFLIWNRMTGKRWRSAFLAALFALHPLHVESVAWISERKDVLSTFFLILSVDAYVRHAKKNQAEDGVRFAGLYWLSLGCFVLALLCKPMVVMLPCLLLVLDFWPLGRITPPLGKTYRTLTLEKLPFFGLALAAATITLLVQFHTGAAGYAARFAFPARLGNAVVSCARYLEMTFWPTRLRIFYHHPGYWPAWAVAGATALIIMVFVLAWWQRGARPWIAFGWLWFLTSLLPVIGLIQVGAQAMADRYTYIPLLGIFTIIAWFLPVTADACPAVASERRQVRMRTGSATSLPDANAHSSKLTGTASAAFWIGMIVAVLALGACFGLTRQQLRAWHDSVSLYRHSIAAGGDNATIRYLLGSALQANGAPESEVLAEYRRALELDPTYVNALTQLAANALNHANNEECRKLIERTLELEPRNPALHKNLGAFYVRTGHPEQAIPHFKAALKLDPSYGDAHHELAWIYLQQNKLEPAIQELEAVVGANAWDAQAHYELGNALARSGRIQESRRELERAVWMGNGR